MSVEWTLKLVDKWSGPARGIIKTAAALREAIAKINKGPDKAAGFDKLAAAAATAQGKLIAIEAAGAQKRLAIEAKLAADKERMMGRQARPRAAPGASRMDSGMMSSLTRGDMRGAFSALGSAEGGLGGIALGGVGMLVSKVYELEKEILQVSARLLYAGAELGVQATTFRAMTEISLKAMLGSTHNARIAYDQILDLSQKLGETPERAMEQYKKMLSTGMKTKDIAPAITAIENAGAALGSKAATAVERAITLAGAKGFMDNRALTGLARAGISVQKIYEQLAKQMGKKVSDVQMLVRKGKLDSAEAIKAIEAVVNAQSGGAATARGSSVPGLAMAIGSQIKDLFAHLDLSPIQGFLGNVLGVLKGPAGTNLQTAISDFFGKMFHALFDPFQGPDGAKKLESFVNTAAMLVERLGNVFDTVAPVISKVVDLIASMSESEQSTGGTGYFSAIIDALTMVMERAMPLAGVFHDLFNLFQAFTPEKAKPISAPGESLTDYLSTQAKAAKVAQDPTAGMLGDLTKNMANDPANDTTQVGVSMVDGIVQGIEDNAAKVIASVEKMCSSAVNAGMAAIGAHSPSVEFAKLGSFTALGYAQGVTNDTSAVTEAVGAMMQPPSASTAMGAGASAAGGGGSKSMTNHFGDIQVNSASTDPRAVAVEVRREVSAYLEELAIELGAA